MRHLMKLAAASAIVAGSAVAAQAQDRPPLFTMICKDYNNGNVLPSVPRDQGVSCPDPSELVLQDEAGYEIRVQTPRDDGQGAGSGYQLRIQDEAGHEIDTSVPRDGIAVTDDG